MVIVEVLIDADIDTVPFISYAVTDNAIYQAILESQL